jgi:hypothetical protein
MDWRQRVSLGLAVAFFAYFVAHTLHRTEAATDPNQELRTALQLQQHEIDSLKQDLATKRGEEAEKRKRRLAIRNQLGVFLDEGRRIQRDIEYSNSAAVQERTAWERRVEEYLAKELDSSYVARFRNPVRVPVTYPEAMSMNMAVYWTDVMERIRVRRTTPLFPYRWRIRTPSPLSLMLLTAKNLWRTHEGYKGAITIEELHSCESQPEPAAG